MMALWRLAVEVLVAVDWDGDPNILPGDHENVVAAGHRASCHPLASRILHICLPLIAFISFSA